MKSRQRKMKPKRYEDYRNQMKLSRKSEEHRHRRNRQMAEAQKLLEDNCISTSPSGSHHSTRGRYEKDETQHFSLDNDQITSPQEVFMERTPKQQTSDMMKIDKHIIPMEFKYGRSQNSLQTIGVEFAKETFNDENSQKSAITSINATRSRLLDDEINKVVSSSLLTHPSDEKLASHERWKDRR